MSDLDAWFIEGAREKHGDRYGYENVQYINSYTKVLITCKIHGDFSQKPNSHKNGQGCPDCAKLVISEKLHDKHSHTKEKFIAKAKSVHGDLYDYSLVEYYNSHTPVKIICSVHGVFEQKPYAHTNNKSGCFDCYHERSKTCQVQPTQKTTKQFIEDAIATHGDTYEYGKVEYVNAFTDVMITCKIHGDFPQRPLVHIRGSGYKLCTLSSKYSIEDLRNMCNEKYGNKYMYIFDENDFGITKYFVVSCEKHGKIDTTPYSHLQSSIGCVRCAYDITNEKTLHHREKEFLVNYKGKYDLSEFVYVNSTTKSFALCRTHGKFETNAVSLRMGHGCPKCSHSGTSKAEKEIHEYISSLFAQDAVVVDHRYKIAGMELDIFVKDFNIGIEYNGLYWHSVRYKTENYHYDKTEKCEQIDIKLIHIYEDQWLYKQDIVKSRLSNLFNNSKNVYARECEVQKISDNQIKEFLEENHLQGHCASKYRYGLFHNDELVSVMSFGSLRKNLGQNIKEGHFELLRFANKQYINVVGGASRLLKRFISDQSPVSILSYADRSWSSEGKSLYNTLGFEFIGKTKPNYYYVFGDTRRNRFSYRKSELVKEGYDESLSEKQIMIDRGIFRIYDSGQLKYQMTFE